MSPEQVQGERGDARSDIYAWGVMMYETLTGEAPFSGDNAMAVMIGHLQGDVRPIRKAGRNAPTAGGLVLHAMRRHPENRYQSANDLVADLNRLDSIDPATYDTSPEKPLGAMAVTVSGRRLWAYAGLTSRWSSLAWSLSSSRFRSWVTVDWVAIFPVDT